MNTLVTGGKGFIGSKLVSRLDGLVKIIDIRDGMNLLTCELPKDIDFIYHLAAQSSVESSWHDPIHDLDNIRIAARLAHAYPNAKIIYANSCAALGLIDSPYGFSKKIAGEYLIQFHKNVVDCVFPNIFGEGSKSVVDIFKGKDEVTIYGDGTHTRDYVHVDDIVEGLLLARRWDAGRYLMGSGNKSYSVNELAKGKKIVYKEERKEKPLVMMYNNTPDWTAKIDVMEYIK